MMDREHARAADALIAEIQHTARCKCCRLAAQEKETMEEEFDLHASQFRSRVRVLFYYALAQQLVIAVYFVWRVAS